MLIGGVCNDDYSCYGLKILFVGGGVWVLLIGIVICVSYVEGFKVLSLY